MDANNHSVPAHGQGPRGAAFRAEGLVKSFRRGLFGRRPALDGVDLDVEAGATTVLLGSNGAGKSTLLRIALGVVSADRGTLTVAGHDALRHSDAVRRAVGYVPDRPDAPGWMTLPRLCTYTAGFLPGFDVEAALELAATLEVPTRTRLADMSKGQAMKTMLVLALGHDPDVLLLDEPFGGLDPLVRTDVLRAVLDVDRAVPRTVLCATHELDVAARIADRIAVMHAGAVRRHGTVAEVLGTREPVAVPQGLESMLEQVVGECADPGSKAVPAQEVVSC